MTVKELRDKLVDLPDDLPVVTAGYDHSYRRLHHANMVEAEEAVGGSLYEFYELIQADNSEKILVVAIG